MNTWPKITGFAAALAVVLGAAYGVGSLAGSDDADTKAGMETSREAEAAEAGGAGNAAEGPEGLQVSAHGYSIDLKTPRIERGRSAEIRFAVLDAQGRPVTDYEVEQEKELHLILASRDLTVYRHLHPTRSADGTWRTPVNLPTAGDYRLFADFAPAAEDGESLTLGTDLAVAGHYEPQELPQQVSTSKVDGYTVTLHGDLNTSSAQDLTFEVRKDGKPVTDLQPYLGAYGHLVALRAGDLAYLHVHPDSEAGDARTKPGPTVSFTATAPRPTASSSISSTTARCAPRASPSGRASAATPPPRRTSTPRTAARRSTGTGDAPPPAQATGPPTALPGRRRAATTEDAPPAGGLQASVMFQVGRTAGQRERPWRSIWGRWS